MRVGTPRWRSFVVFVAVTASHGAIAHADVPRVRAVVGTEITQVRVAARRDALAATPPSEWAALSTTNVTPGPRWLSFEVPAASAAVLIPVCAGRKHVFVDDVETELKAPTGVVDVPPGNELHHVVLELAVGGYEHRIACSTPPRAGTRATTTDGLIGLTFPSPHAGGGEAVLYVPPGHDLARPSALLVGLHPWNGGMWTYAAYDELLAAARARDVVLLFPSGLGNSLYTAPAEDEVLRAIAAARGAFAVDPDRITLWGASMGGAGATTVGFHHPDAFAAIVSLFGDSRYDLATYVRSVLHDEKGAHAVNSLEIAENVRNVPVWLIHGEDDHVSPIAQSAVLARALHALGFRVTFDRVLNAGHEGRVVAAFAARIVDLAAEARRVVAPRRVSYWSVRPGDTTAYGIRLERADAAGDAFFDLGRRGDSLHLTRATGVRSLSLPRGAFGFAPTLTPHVVNDDPDAHDVRVTWDTVP